jgi:hypothetical protein
MVLAIAIGQHVRIIKGRKSFRNAGNSFQRLPERFKTRQIEWDLGRRQKHSLWAEKRLDFMSFEIYRPFWLKMSSRKPWQKHCSAKAWGRSS